LLVRDLQAADVGTINSWSLTLNTGIANNGVIPGNTMDQNSNSIQK